MNFSSKISCFLAALALSLNTYLAATHAAEKSDTPKRHFTAQSSEAAAQWQAESREQLFDLLKLTDLQATRLPGGKPIPFDTKTLSTEDRGSYTRSEIELNSTATRRIKAILTIPKSSESGKKFPAVVCIHGHSGSRQIVYDRKSVYRGFATELAEDGYVTISTEVGQHEVYEPDRSLMGERLWDVLRCADYLTTLPEVDADRMGCAGLSLGGEMSMWLGAMDPRMKVTISSGFLTTVANLKDRHCQCWDFPGFTENYEFSDIYSLIAPRALQCQIGEKERAPGGFPVDIARVAIAEIEDAYAVCGAKDRAELHVHPEGHVYAVPAGHNFIAKYLNQPAAASAK